MAKLRAGDYVTFNAVVLSTASHGDGQQIMARILPYGETIGWCIPTENAFVPTEQPIAKGDIVRFKNDADGVKHEVLHMFEDKQIAVREVGEKPVKITYTNRVERI